MSYVAGIDISSFTLNCAVIPFDRDGVPVFMEYELGRKRRDSLITRIAAVYGAVAGFGFTFPKWHSVWPGLRVAVEEPRGNGRLAVPATWGALVAELGRNMVETASLTSLDWRAELGRRDSKEGAFEAVADWFVEANEPYLPLTEHEIDALGVALAWRSMLRKQEAAA